jgi:hypothetical protein
MSTKKPVADPDIEPEYSFRESIPNPYAERYCEGHVPRVTRSKGSTTVGRPVAETDAATRARKKRPG